MFFFRISRHVPRGGRHGGEGGGGEEKGGRIFREEVAQFTAHFVSIVTPEMQAHELIDCIHNREMRGFV